MRMLKVLVVAIALCLLASTLAFAQSVEKIGDNAKIDWTNLCYIAEGQGAVPKADKIPNRAQAFLAAKDYAKMDAIANLLMAIEGTAISYESTGKDYMAETTIRQKIEGFVKHVEILKTEKETVEGDTIVKITVKAPMFGTPNSPGNVFLSAPAPTEVKPVEVKPVETTTEVKTTTTVPEVTVETTVKVITKPDNPKVVPKVQEVKAVTIDPSAPDVTTGAKPSVPGKPYTGVIIDATGYKIDRAMSPHIRKADGSEVWGTVTADFDLVLDRGIVSYATSLEDAKKLARVGSNPMIIRAIGRSGGKFYCDPVISDGDAELLLYENGKSKFLNNSAVVFVKDKRTY